MDKTYYKSKRFLFPILALVLIAIISIASISSYITIGMYKTHMQEHIKNTTKEYTQQHKDRVYKEVQAVSNSIKFQISKMEDKLKASLKEKILIALDVAHYTYDTYKDTLSKEEIKEKIAEALAIIKFNENRSYYFMYDNKTKIIFGHPVSTFIGRDMTNFKDAKGENIMERDAEILANNKIGFNEIYFTKPENQIDEFPKISCIAKFEPLDLVLGIGEYRDVIEKQTKAHVLSRFALPEFNDKDRYLTIVEVHNIEGGDDFGTFLLSSSKLAFQGTNVSDEDKDIKGNRFRKDILTVLREKGEGFVEYWYQKPSTKIPSLKLSYFYLQKDWNWIIGSGFYYEDLEKQIAIMEENISTYTTNTIVRTLIWVMLLSFLAIVIAVVVSLRIDKTIKEYTDQIIEYESDKREQENRLMQQGKLAAMGEMIGNIAHQWRQPLAIISMGANNIMVDVDLDAIDKQNLRKSAEDIAKQTIYLSQTIDDFRSYIKGDREKMTFSLNETIHTFLDLVKGPIKHSFITLVLELKDNVDVMGYKNELIQCFINIFNNAKDILVENNVEEKLIFISTSVENDNAIIKIKDNGGGIAEEILPKLFEPYFTTKHKAQGTGLGLHMTYNLIVNTMTGSIDASTVTYEHDGKKYTGAEFTITLPMR